MTAEIWLFVVLGAVVALAVGFFVGRRSAPTQQRLEAMARERDEARQEADRVQGEVARHFEHSARMFGRLADDYRSFFEHFAETAQNLGLSEGRARELLQRADPRLVADQSAARNPGDEPASSGPDVAAATGRAPGEEAEAQRHTAASAHAESAAPESGAEGAGAGPVSAEAGESEEDEQPAGETTEGERERSA